MQFNKELLSQFSYHPLYGLYHDEKSREESMFSKEVNALLENENRLHELKTQIEEIAGYPWIIRFFFRFFNIRNYAKNGHMLTACCLLADTKEEQCVIASLII